MVKTVFTNITLVINIFYKTIYTTQTYNGLLINTVYKL